jgi:glucose-1-phosphate thymidylyltransferase
MIGVVPAAGEGTRLRPLTDEKPKGLVTVAGDPLLAHVFETLRASGVDELVVVVGYEADVIRSHFGTAFEDVPITYVEQDEQLGLGHAVLQARSHVDGSFVLLNGDNVVAGDLRTPIERQRRDEADAVVAVERVDRATAREVGVVSVDDERVTGIVEKPADPPSTLATTGCYVLPIEIFDALELLRPSERGEYELADALGVLVRAGLHVEAVPLACERVNVNEPDDVATAEAVVANSD